MITELEFGWYSDNDKVLESAEALVYYQPWNGKYIAIDKGMRGGNGYGYYHRSTTGDIERCIKAFERYSPTSLLAYRYPRG